MDPGSRRRFARQLLLVEIGEAGQERLCGSAVKLGADADPRAAAVAQPYLERAGLQVLSATQTAPDQARPLALPDAGALRALAGSAELDEAAAALAGAFAAVEAIKAALAIGTQAQLPPGWRLRSEASP